MRLDTHAYEGYKVPPFYDSLLAKLIVWGSDREQAIARSQRALAEFEIEGVRTTKELFTDILAEPEFRSGHYTTAYLERRREFLPALFAEEAA